MKIRELLTENSKWTRGAMARDDAGVPVVESGSSAVCWCLVGAAWKCYPEFSERTGVIRKMSLKIGAIGDWNDSHNFTDVRKLIEELDI